jgi:hypothetical protein
MVANPLLLESLAVLGATALAFVIVALAAIGLWRAVCDERPLLLAEVLAFEGIDMGEHVTGAGARQFALAASKCMRCGAREPCEGWLAGRHAGGYEAFCPNARYVDRLKAGNS